MKKVILLLFSLLVAVSVMAQTNILRVSGVVTDSASGNPAANYPVHIDIDSASGGFIYHHEVHTMPNGFYADSIFFAAGYIPTGIVRVSTWDCMQHLRIGNFAFGPGNLIITKDFLICTGPPPPPCHADFYPVFSPPPSLSVHFINTSVGINGPWQWSFGDGTSSGLFDPFHVYATSGLYHVTLTMGDSLNGGCFSYESHEVMVGDSTGGGCHAEFSWNCDSNNTVTTIHFNNLTLGQGFTWNWSFGDSTFSADYNPTHTYAHPGDFHVCLTITRSNPACQDVECKEVHVGPPPPPPCASWFSHVPDWLLIHFDGHMPPNHPAAYSWNFGDGTTGNGEHVDHTYSAPGLYAVTLTTVTQDSMQCSWTSTQQIPVWDSTDFHHVSGHVFTGNTPLTFGMVMIFSVDTMPNTPPFFAFDLIHPMGEYLFPAVPNGNYVIWAMPFDSAGQYLPTFFGDKIHWEQATIIHLGQPQNPYDIHLVHAISMNAGQGGINGHVNTQGLKSTQVDQITMLLSDETGEPIGFRRVNTSGGFDFSGVAFGTYYLKPELPNTTSDVVKVVLSASKPVAVVNMTMNGKSILGISENSIVESFTAYPNPIQDALNLSINVVSPATGTVEILTMTGQAIAREAFTLTKGANQVEMNVSNLNHGIYLLKISSPDGIRIVQKLVK